MIVRLAPELYEKLKKLDVRIRNGFEEKILIFSKNPNAPQLNNHPLKRDYLGYRSIDITEDYRAVYLERKEGEELSAYFIAIGTHKELYNT